MKVNFMSSRDAKIPGKPGKACPREMERAAQHLKVQGRACGPSDAVSPRGRGPWAEGGTEGSVQRPSCRGLGGQREDQCRAG